MQHNLQRHLRRSLDTVRRAVRDHQLWQPGARLLVACSGGGDSMALWALLEHLQPSLGHSLVVGHIDHGLQSGIEAERVVRAYAAQTQTQVAVTHLALHAGADVQGRARTARYAALRTMATQLGADIIVTGHHADDQAETLLMRACRGAGVGALAGIRRSRTDGVARPVLDLDRADLLAVLTSLNVAWWDDPSNTSAAYQRNRFRHDVLPALETAAPGAARGLARTAANAAGQAEAMAHWVAAAAASQAVISTSCIELPRVFVPVDTALLAPLLAWIYGVLALKPPSQGAVQQLVQTLRASPQVRPAKAEQPGNLRPASAEANCRLSGIEVRINNDKILFSAASGRKSEHTNVARPPGAD